MKQITMMTIVPFLILVTTGCSWITDFDGSLLDTDLPSLYSLSENVANEIEVELLENGTATISIDLLNPLPEAKDSADLLVLLGQTVSLQVEKMTTGVTVNLTDGSRINTQPTSAGQYMLSLEEDRLTVSVIFMNETVNGKSLDENESYVASISVVTENSFFIEETFTRDVTFAH